MSNLEGTISSLDPLDQLSGNEMLEVAYQGHNFRIMSSQLFGQQGKSAYQVAVDNGYQGTQVQWLTSLIGPRGMSAYQTAVENGFVGDVAAWLASLRGEDGADGIDGTHGKTAYELAVEAGFQGDVLAWLASLRGEDGVDGTAGKTAYELAVEDGFQGDLSTWLVSLRGTDGQDGKSAYELAVENGFVGDVTAWLASLHGDDGQAGENGLDGLSAYQIAKLANPDLADEAAFIASLKGQDGIDGKSAFEIAAELDPAITTEEEFIASLKGEKGDPGDAGGGSSAGLIDIMLTADAVGLPDEPLAGMMLVISEEVGGSTDPYTIDIESSGLAGLLPGQYFRIHNNTTRPALIGESTLYQTYFANGDTTGTIPSYGSVTITNITTSTDPDTWLLVENYEVGSSSRVIEVPIAANQADPASIQAGDLFIIRLEAPGGETTPYAFQLGNAVLAKGESIRIFNGTDRHMEVSGNDVWTFSFAHPAEWPMVKPRGHVLLTRIDDGVDPRLLVVGDLQDEVPPTFLTADHTDLEPMRVVHVSRRNTVYGTTVSRTIPTDVMIDDLMIVVTASGGNNDLGVPAGWTLAAEAIDQPNQGTACRMYSRHVQFGDAGQTITWSSSLGENDMAMQLIIFRGAKRPEILTSAIADSAAGITDSLPIANVESSEYQQIALAANVSDYYSGRFLAPEGWVQVSPIVESESDGFSNSFLAVAYKRLALGETTGSAVFNNPDDDEVDAFTSAVTLLIGQI